MLNNDAWIIIDLNHSFSSFYDNLDYKSLISVAIESIKEVRIGRKTELHRAVENHTNDLQVGYDNLFYRMQQNDTIYNNSNYNYNLIIELIKNEI